MDDRVGNEVVAWKSVRAVVTMMLLSHLASPSPVASVHLEEELVHRLVPRRVQLRAVSGIVLRVRHQPLASLEVVVVLEDVESVERLVVRLNVAPPCLPARLGAWAALLP